jgi:hypothetical protein
VFGVYEYSWGTAVRNEETGEWTNVFTCDGKAIVTEGLDVTVGAKGVVFNEKRHG